MSLIEKWFHKIEWGQAPDRILKEIESDLRKAIDEMIYEEEFTGSYMLDDKEMMVLFKLKQKIFGSAEKEQSKPKTLPKQDRVALLEKNGKECPVEINSHELSSPSETESDKKDDEK